MLLMKLLTVRGDLEYFVYISCMAWIDVLWFDPVHDQLIFPAYSAVITRLLQLYLIDSSGMTLRKDLFKSMYSDHITI